MTHRSRNGGPPKTHRKTGPKNGQPRKLHHPPPTNASAESSTSAFRTHPALSNPTDQDILDTLHQALQATLTSPNFVPTVQKIKGLLYEAKWLEVFMDPELLEAYTGRWVPSRALCFRELMVHLGDVRTLILGQVAAGETAESDDEEDESGDSDEDEDEDKDEVDDGRLRVISLGGGAGSELLAFSSLLSYRRSRKGKERAVEWIGADIGKWGTVLGKIQDELKGKWGLDGLNVRYIEGDLLGPDPVLLKETVSSAALSRPLDDRTTPEDPSDQYQLPKPAQQAAVPFPADPSPSLVTLLFTLTELLSQSPSSTIAFLRNLSTQLPPGTLFLVADSASDIASFSLGSERRWPTFTIIDLVMTKMIQGGWELVDGQDSRWFRMAEGVRWPVKVENTRYWFRLYRKLP